MTKYNIFDDPLLADITDRNPYHFEHEHEHEHYEPPTLRQRRKRYAPIVCHQPNYQSIPNDYEVIQETFVPNILSDFWSNINWRDVAREKIKGLDCDITFSVMPSDEFIDDLLNEPQLPMHMEPIMLKDCEQTDYLNEAPVINITKCKKPQISYDVDYCETNNNQDLLEQMAKELDEFIKQEIDYQDKHQESINEEPQEEIIEQPVQIDIEDCEDLPLGYSPIDLDDYEILSLSDENDYDDARTVTFNSEVVKHSYQPYEYQEGYNRYKYDNNYYDKYGRPYDGQSFYGNAISTVLNWIH